MIKKSDLITIDPDICGGAPVFTGTRVLVETLVDYLSSGETLETFLDEFPSVSREMATEFLSSAAEALIADIHEPAH
jgi:uncharacterized protein (DUF433 family)